jgi:fatty-acyl-CoA synthase
MIFEHGRRVWADSRVLTFDGQDVQEASYAEVADRADRLAAALHRLGVREGDRVGTFCWNNRHHLEAYFAVPCLGAILHTLNIRLFPEQLVYVINHAEDRVIIVDASLVPLLSRVRDQLETVEHIIVVGKADTTGLGATLDWDEVIAAETPGFSYPEVDERAGAAMCYTSGTTGNPKGVLYSHRSTFLHSLGVNGAPALGIDQHDRILLIVPMFHACAWGLPYAGWLAGSDFVMPQQFLQAGPLADLVARTRPTFSGAVPTVLSDLLNNAGEADLSCLRLVVCGGSAVPESLFRGFDETFGVPILQGWGSTARRACVESADGTGPARCRDAGLR